jgi:hypothetical protein
MSGKVMMLMRKKKKNGMETLTCDLSCVCVWLEIKGQGGVCVYFNIVEPSDIHEASGCWGWGGDLYICDFIGVGLALLVWYMILHGSPKTNISLIYMVKHYDFRDC